MHTHTKHIPYKTVNSDKINSTWQPQAYAVYSHGQTVWAKELIEKIGINGDESILDVGCGDGKITDYLSALTQGKVVGVDLNADMIAFAQATFERAIFMQMDAQKLEFEERFDIVFSNAALHWVSNHEAVVSGIYRALKPGGKAILQMGGYGNAHEIFDALESVVSEFLEYFDGFVSPYTFCSDSTYEQLLENAGFSRYRAELIPKDMIHTDTVAFRGWLETTWFPYIQRIPEEMREVFIRRWMEAYITLHPLDEGGRIHISMIRLEIKAEKGE